MDQNLVEIYNLGQEMEDLKKLLLDLKMKLEGMKNE